MPQQKPKAKATPAPKSKKAPVEPAKPTPDKKIGKNSAPNLEALAQELGCDRETIRRHMKTPGSPGRKANHSYDIPAWRAWMEVHGSIRIDSPEKKDQEVKRLQWINCKLELEVDEIEGRSVELDEATTVICGILKEFQMELRQAKHRLAPEVGGLSVGEANARIGKDLEECLGRVAIPDYLKKKPFWRSVHATLSALHASCSPGPGENRMSL